MPRIALDAMGGDHAPERELDAAVQVLRERRDDLGVILVGDEGRLREGLARRGASPGPGLEIRHASQVISMDDHPAQAARGKKDSSMRIAFELVKSGEADAVVSAGNSGAMLACGLLVLRRVPGALRPGISAVFPTLTGSCVLCDMGANVEVKPAVLAQFGLLGAVYARVAQGKPHPRLGLLSNGEEESKGTELTREAHAILKRLGSGAGAPFELAGYVEGKDIFTGAVDVVATDGFTGNVVLKTTEGAASAIFELLGRAFRSSVRARAAALLAMPALREMKKRLDYAESGGAPLLGVGGLAIVCHGRSTAIALKNAVLAAGRHAEQGLARHVAEELARHAAALGEAEPAQGPTA